MKVTKVDDKVIMILTYLFAFGLLYSNELHVEILFYVVNEVNKSNTPGMICPSYDPHDLFSPLPYSMYDF